MAEDPGHYICDRCDEHFQVPDGEPDGILIEVGAFTWEWPQTCPECNRSIAEQLRPILGEPVRPKPPPKAA